MQAALLFRAGRPSRSAGVSSRSTLGLCFVRLFVCLCVCALRCMRSRTLLARARGAVAVAVTRNGHATRTHAARRRKRFLLRTSHGTAPGTVLYMPGACAVL